MLFNEDVQFIEINSQLKGLKCHLSNRGRDFF